MKTILMASSAIPVTPEERRRFRPVSRNNSAFQRMLSGFEKVAVWADELGIDAIGSTEHHFQYEGGESVPNNLLLYAKLATLTKRIMFIPMSVVLPTHDPIRVAEDLALFSHMFPGRLGVAFARGFMTRWAQTLAQSEDGVSNRPESEAANRAKYNEYLGLVLEAWTKDSIQHEGPYYQVPFPAAGIPDWPLADWTREYGVPGDVDENGTIHRIGITPAPLNMPEIFVPSTRASQTIIDTAEHGHNLFVAAGGKDRILEVAHLYRDSAQKAGHDVALGQNFGVVTKISLGETFEEAFDLAVETAGFWYQNFFQKFGFNEGYRLPSDPPGYPLRFPDARALMQRMHESGQLACGTPAQVREQLHDIANLYGEGKLDWLLWEFLSQSMPFDDWDGVQHYQLETYAKHVMPEFQ